ncbi:MAG: 50S ribosomal protein L2 [Candidatus Methylarchaceae archaeon HK01M]|nr:50S ribosomal protein L2 [Candidatus Methylarchaceae archaeon HK01M]
MGKRILSQRRGRGGMQYRSSKKGKVAPAKYPALPISETRRGNVTRLIDERGRSAPLAQITFDDREITYLPAVDGLYVGHEIEIGHKAEPRLGNILPLEKIPEGMRICNLERSVGDGGKLIRAAGGSAILFSKTPMGVLVKLPSGKMVALNVKCRAMIGEIAGSGRLEKPLLKAGAKYHAMKAKGRLYPRVRGMAMAAVHHPFGGGRHQHSIHKSKSTSKTAPPGAKVGNIASRKTGRSRKKRIKKRMF